MRYGAGTLALSARRAGTRTILERVRYDGISRCSRAFPHGKAALVVLSQLGPGVVRGDRISTTGHLHAGSHLIVTNQTATRLMGGARRSESRASWSIDENAILELVGEPLVAAASAHYDASTTVDLAAGSILLLTDLAWVGAGAEVRVRTSVRQFGQELFYDAIDAAAAAPKTVGTLAVVGLGGADVAPVTAALDRASDELGEVSVGVGAMSTATFARVLATDIWTVRATLIALRQAVWNALRVPR